MNSRKALLLPQVRMPAPLAVLVGAWLSKIGDQ